MALHLYILYVIGVNDTNSIGKKSLYWSHFVQFVDSEHRVCKELADKYVYCSIQSFSDAVHVHCHCSL